MLIIANKYRYLCIIFGINKTNRIIYNDNLLFQFVLNILTIILYLFQYDYNSLQIRIVFLSVINIISYLGTYFKKKKKNLN